MRKSQKKYIVWDVEKARPVFQGVASPYRDATIAADALEGVLDRPIMVLPA